jgi:hypothetical protein
MYIVQVYPQMLAQALAIGHMYGFRDKIWIFFYFLCGKSMGAYKGS